MAEDAGVSESTVRRMVDGLSDLLLITNGTVSTEDQVTRDKFTGLFRTIDTQLSRGLGSIRKLASQRTPIDEESPLARWASRYGASVDNHSPDSRHYDYRYPDALEIEINLGELTEWELIQIVRAGYQAAKQAGAFVVTKYVNSVITWTDTNGTKRTTAFGKFGPEYRILGAPIDRKPRRYND